MLAASLHTDVAIYCNINSLETPKQMIPFMLNLGCLCCEK